MRSIKRLYETLIVETKCPQCGTDGAYVGFNSVECKNRKCMNFSDKAAAGDKRKFVVYIEGGSGSADRPIIKRVTASSAVEAYEMAGGRGDPHDEETGEVEGEHVFGDDAVWDISIPQAQRRARDVEDGLWD